jgi:CD2 antigen cytoplasmic tail-binding protein 2
MPPKRARADSDTFLEGTSNFTKDSAPPKKRARFAEDEDDETLIVNDIDDNLETRARRGRVKVEGYESDSTDEGESVVRSRRKGLDGDEDDMFAMASDNEQRSKSEGAKKMGTKWMSLGDIDGQEFGGGSADEDNRSVSESEPEDEDDRIRRSKKGMGYEFTKFNMKEEMAEGKFAEDGTYVRSFDQHATHDRWLEDVDENEMKKARRAKRKAERIERDRIREEERHSRTAEQDQASMGMELVTIMRPGETVLETLARLGKVKKQKETRTGATKKKRKPHESAKADPNATPEAAPPPSDIDRVTDISSKLLPSSPEIYSTTYEAILRSVRRSGMVPEDWVPPKPNFEYKWTVEGATTQGVNGPYSEEEIRTWFNAGYFGDSGERIALRVVGTEEWEGWNELFGK